MSDYGWRWWPYLLIPLGVRLIWLGRKLGRPRTFPVTASLEVAARPA